ncbi:HAD hydrolase family protein [Bacillus sp. SL00103]
MIATDLDGTLLNSEHKVSRENEQALKEANGEWNGSCRFYRKSVF